MTNLCAGVKRNALPRKEESGDAGEIVRTVYAALKPDTMEQKNTSTQCLQGEEKMNSKKKGSRGERDCRDVWRKHGYEEAHRSQQFSGRGESAADIEGVDPRLHIEVKSGYSYKTVYAFLEQAIRDAKEGQIPIVNCKMDRKEWLCVMRLDDFIEIWKERR